MHRSPSRRLVAVVVAALVVVGATACDPPAPPGANPTSWRVFQAWLRNDREAVRKDTSTAAVVTKLFAVDRNIAKSLEFNGCRSRAGAEYCAYTNGWNVLTTVRQTASPYKIIDAYAQDIGTEPATVPFALYLAWRNGDRQRALQFGTPGAVADLFELDPNTGLFGDLTFEQCSRVTYPSGPQDICQFDSAQGLIELSGPVGYKVAIAFSEY